MPIVEISKNNPTCHFKVHFSTFDSRKAESAFTDKNVILIYFLRILAIPNKRTSLSYYFHIARAVCIWIVDLVR